MEPTTIILGKEYDADVRRLLFRVLHDLNAKLVSEEHAVAGSQDLEILSFRVGGEPLVVESETYIGLSIQGEKSLVLLIQSLMNEHA